MEPLLPPARSVLAYLALVALLTPVACGQWVAYDDGAPVAGAAPEAVRGADRLSHLALAGPAGLYVRATGDGSQVGVDYPGWGDDREARFLLDQYLAILSVVDPDGLVDGAERLAYWVNAYNAAVIQGVLDEHGGNPAYRVIDGPFFDTPRVTLGGERLTLNEVEHGVIRGDESHPAVAGAGPNRRAMLAAWHVTLWGGGPVDPRVHAALNCAARSCPNLLAGPPFVYRAAALEAQLQSATRDWLDDPDKGAGPEGISALFDWYREDFEANNGSVDAFIEAHRTAGLAGVDTTRTLPYDWTLNRLP